MQNTPEVSTSVSKGDPLLFSGNVSPLDIEISEVLENLMLLIQIEKLERDFQIIKHRLLKVGEKISIWVRLSFRVTNPHQ